MGKHSFTLLELIIVTAILLFSSALVLPRLTLTPRRITVENALSAIRTAFSETAARARALNKDLILTLDLENNQFLVSENLEFLPNDWHPETEESPSAQYALSVKESYPLPKGIRWNLAETGADQQEQIIYAFFQDGQAVGNPLQFTIGNESFQCDVDRLSGNALIMSLDQN